MGWQHSATHLHGNGGVAAAAAVAVVAAAVRAVWRRQ